MDLVEFRKMPLNAWQLTYISTFTFFYDMNEC